MSLTVFLFMTAAIFMCLQTSCLTSSLSQRPASLPITHVCPSRSPPSSPASFDLPSVEKRPLHILVTGGAGYIGSHMCLLLLSSSVAYDITIVDDLSRGNMFLIQRLNTYNSQHHNRNLTFHKLNLAKSYSQLVGLLKNIDVVIHFAGWAYASESVLYPLQYFENTVESTRVLLSAMQKANVSKLLYSSSSATYGDVADVICDIPIRENTPQTPSSPYGTAKLQSEQMIKAVHRARSPSFSVALLRYFNVVGADSLGRLGPLPRPALKKFGRIVDACFGSALSGQPLKVYGDDYPTHDGFAIRDYIHVSDIVQAHMKVLLAVMSGTYLLEYNIGINQGFSVLEVIKATEKVTGKPVAFDVLPRRVGDPAIVIGNASRLERELLWVPQFKNFTEIIATAWRWQQKYGHYAADPMTKQRKS